MVIVIGHPIHYVLLGNIEHKSWFANLAMPGYTFKNLSPGPPGLPEFLELQ